ncbi:MAG: flavodoxin family protein [Candidatus Hermodarchaeota archaeon]
MILILVKSIHHGNTQKVAEVFAKVLDAQIKTPEQVNIEEFQQYSLIGFGSGIYGGKHHTSLLKLADNLPQVKNHKAFIFSTDGAPRALIKYDLSFEKEKLSHNHDLLREKLKSKGYTIVGEFLCGGFNTNNVLKLFGGINKGRPNAEDLKHAEVFAENLKLNKKN